MVINLNRAQDVLGKRKRRASILGRMFVQWHCCLNACCLNLAQSNVRLLLSYMVTAWTLSAVLTTVQFGLGEDQQHGCVKEPGRRNAALKCVSCCCPDCGGVFVEGLHSLQLLNLSAWLWAQDLTVLKNPQEPEGIQKIRFVGKNLSVILFCWCCVQTF